MSVSILTIVFPEAKIFSPFWFSLILLYLFLTGFIYLNVSTVFFYVSFLRFPFYDSIFNILSPNGRVRFGTKTKLNFEDPNFEFAKIFGSKYAKQQPYNRFIFPLLAIFHLLRKQPWFGKNKLHPTFLSKISRFSISKFTWKKIHKSIFTYRKLFKLWYL